MGNKDVGSQGAQMVQLFQRPLLARNERPLHRGKMLIDVTLKDYARLGT
jgi:hypothetical protein